ncbi:hypothetical protein DSCO28_73740 (plasmid) [Desulfosarcina ovata subsp. sediminis]|uniref:Conjugal transfer protein TraG n=1 Tax=Desulfosarcina ovata subsp. sediminis TaxID=885957 RepID=A0A5K8A313_9BACT|nr:hypothetical protein DSCO28_73740 [Desulfosarcina ovata subsp. sediminis]
MSRFPLSEGIPDEPLKPVPLTLQNLEAWARSEAENKYPLVEILPHEIPFHFRPVFKEEEKQTTDDWTEVLRKRFGTKQEETEEYKRKRLLDRLNQAHKEEEKQTTDDWTEVLRKRFGEEHAGEKTPSIGLWGSLIKKNGQQKTEKETSYETLVKHLQKKINDKYNNKMAHNKEQLNKRRAFIAENANQKQLDYWNKRYRREWKKEHEKWEDKKWDIMFSNFFDASRIHHKSLSTILFLAGFSLLTWFLLGGGKYSLMDLPGGEYGHIISIYFFVPYVLSLIFLKTDFGNVINCAFFFGVPILSALVIPYFVIVKELLKETDFYQELFIEGKGREIARWGSFRSFHRHDISQRFRESRQYISKHKESSFYLGTTKWYYDYKIPMLGQRHIGTKSEQHLIVVAGTGSGKSRDILNNNTLTYSGGMVIFDTKGEHVEISYGKRSRFAKAYVIDPWGKNKLGISTAHWNPLAGIDINSDNARSRIERICESIVIKESDGAGERPVDTHFREAPQQILRGFIAHVLSTLPEEYHNLPTVTNLMFKGTLEGGNFDPDEMDNVINAMSSNTVCQGAPIEAAATIAKLQGSEESGIWTTLQRSLNWINDPMVRKVISGETSFSFRECKLNDATVYLVIPENFLIQQRRFIRLFYQTAFDELDEHYTPQPNEHKRRVAFIFDEFEVLGTFEAARQAALRKRSSFIKCVFVVQNFGQFKANYTNVQDFFGNCDKVFFGIDRSDTEILKKLCESLGKYTHVEYVRGEPVEKISDLMAESELANFMNARRKGQLFIPVKGLQLKMKRAHYDDNFWEHKRGGIKAFLYKRVPNSEKLRSFIEKLKTDVSSWIERQGQRS